MYVYVCVYIYISKYQGLKSTLIKVKLS
jgi:hypothetical protein